MANIAKMAILHDVHSLQLSKELPSSPASKLKNAFNPVFQQALREGAVSITRNNRREAVVMSAELYDQIVVELASRDPLEVLRKEYNARFAATQTAETREAFESAFNASPQELGEAAIAQADE